MHFSAIRGRAGLQARVQALVGRRGNRQALSSKIKDCLDLFFSQAIEHLHNLVNGQPVFKIFKDRLYRYASAAKDPSPAYFAGYAFDRWAL